MIFPATRKGRRIFYAMVSFFLLLRTPPPRIVAFTPEVYLKTGKSPHFPNTSSLNRPFLAGAVSISRPEKYLSSDRRRSLSSGAGYLSSPEAPSLPSYWNSNRSVEVLTGRIRLVFASREVFPAQKVALGRFTGKNQPIFACDICFSVQAVISLSVGCFLGMMKIIYTD